MSNLHTLNPHQLYNVNPDDGIVLAEPRLLTFSSRVILDIMSSIRSGTPSEVLQNGWLAANVAPSHGRLNPWSFPPGRQQRLSFASGSRHFAAGAGGDGVGDGDGGQGE